MLYIIMSAIMWLSPMQGHVRGAKYADLIEFESRWYGMNPFRVMSLIQLESGWKPRKKSVTNDYGLMQVHVARRGSSNFYGREKELYDPRTNIREGVRILAMWYQYHKKYCKESHPFVAHYKWGKYVKNTEHADRVEALRTQLERKFHKTPPALLTMKGTE